METINFLFFKKKWKKWDHNFFHFSKKDPKNGKSRFWTFLFCQHDVNKKVAICCRHFHETMYALRADARPTLSPDHKTCVTLFLRFMLTILHVFLKKSQEHNGHTFEKTNENAGKSYRNVSRKVDKYGRIASQSSWACLFWEIEIVSGFRIL